MKPAKSLTQAEHDHTAFFEYVKEMRNSVGKRFLEHLIQDGGHESFEVFWAKLREAQQKGAEAVELSKVEQQALAKAIYASSRRELFRIATGLGLCVAASVAGKSGVDELREGTLRGRVMPADEAALAAIKIAGFGAGGMIGVGLTFKSSEPTSTTISEIARGPDGAKNVAKLIHSLDALIRPVEMALLETGAPPRR